MQDLRCMWLKELKARYCACSRSADTVPVHTMSEKSHALSSYSMLDIAIIAIHAPCEGSSGGSRMICGCLRHVPKSVTFLAFLDLVSATHICPGSIPQDCHEWCQQPRAASRFVALAVYWWAVQKVWQRPGPSNGPMADRVWPTKEVGPDEHPPLLVKAC